MAQAVLFYVQQVKGRIDSLISDQNGNAFGAFLTNLEHKTNVKRQYFAYGLATLLSSYLVMGYFAQIVCNSIGLAYPAYMSFKAIRTVQKDDDTQWLTYWVVFATFSLLDFCSEKIMSWIPLYWLGKCVFLLYLALPNFRGSQKIYDQYLEPIFTKYEKIIFGVIKDELEKNKEVKEMLESIPESLSYDETDEQVYNPTVTTNGITLQETQQMTRF